MRKINLLVLCLGLLLLSCGRDKGTRVSEMDDLAHARIAVLMGSTHDAYITENYPRAKVLRMDAEADLFLAMDNGVADACVYDRLTYLSSYDKTGKYKEVGSVYIEPLGIGFSKGDPELVAEFNAFLAETRKDGTYDAIYNEFWGDGTLASLDGGDFPEPTKEPLRYACPGTMMAFCFVRDGELSGMDAELVKLFARRTGRPLEMQMINFGGLIAAIASGKADVISGGMTITEERSKKVTFSDPYVESGAAVIVPVGKEGEVDGKPRYATIEDAAEARCAVITGNLYDKYVTENMPSATPMRYDTYPDVMLSLDSGNSDVAFVEGVVYEVSLKKSGKYKILDRLFDDPYGFGFNKKDKALRDQFNEFLKQINSDGTYKQMCERWLDNLETAKMPELPAPGEGKPIRFASCGATDVFDFVADGKPAGFDIELIERFGRYAGRPIEYLTLNFGSLITALASGRADVIGSAITITEERAQKIDFSDTYYLSHALAIVLNERYGGAQHPDVATARIAAMTGTTGEMYIREHYPQADVQDFDDINDALMSLSTAKSDYVVTTYTTALTAARKAGGMTVLPERFFKAANAMAVSKKDPALLAGLNEVITQMSESGELQQVIDRWVRPDGSDYVVESVPQVESGTPIRVGISATREPVGFISGGDYAGLDIELIKRVAYKLGRPVEFHDMKFASLIAALESGKIDMIISNMTPTDERRKKVDFTVGYFENPDVLLALDHTVPVAQGEQKSWLQRVKESFYNNLILEQRYMLVVKGLLQTLLITLFAALLGTVLGGVVCAMRMSRSGFVNGFARGYINLIRGIPVLVLLMILFYVVFASSGLSATIVAVITFALNMAAYSSEMFRTAIQSVDKGQKEAGIALGFTKVQTFINIIMPQAVRTVLPVYKGELISMLKMTSVVGYIAVVDLTKASDIIRSRTFDAFFPLLLVAAVYFLIAWLIGVALDYLNNKIPASK